MARGPRILRIPNRLYAHTPLAAAPKIPAFARIRPWTKTLRPHPFTTRLSRFRGGFAPSATKATPLAHNIYQARAQLTVDNLSVPFDMSLSSDGTILAMSTGGGWKGRNPLLRYYLLADQSSDFLEGIEIDPGLTNVAHYITTDDSRKLVFLADENCVKSFSFAPDDSGKVPKRLLNEHTLTSPHEFVGPLARLPNGRVARAGKGKAAVWDLDAPTSSHSTVVFADDPDFFPAAWHLHEPSGHLICAERAVESCGYACISIDLEHGGRRVSRFLGHGGEVEKIATSPADPNVFITAGSDGFARLFDVRRPLPVLTFNTGLQREGCTDVVLVHPDGIPSKPHPHPPPLSVRPPCSQNQGTDTHTTTALFTGGDLTQQVKMWDIRAEECVYELSTGNNAVASLAWDPARSALFVATECRYVNRMGVRTGYRRARIPRWATWKAVDKEGRAYREALKAGTMDLERLEGEAGRDGYGGMDYPDVYDDYLGLDDAEGGGEGRDEDEEEEEDEEEDIDEAYSADMRWPQKCFHKEDFFGYAYDAGENVLCEWMSSRLPSILMSCLMIF